MYCNFAQTGKRLLEFFYLNFEFHQLALFNMSDEIVRSSFVKQPAGYKFGMPLW